MIDEGAIFRPMAALILEGISFKKLEIGFNCGASVWSDIDAFCMKILDWKLGLRIGWPQSGKVNSPNFASTEFTDSFGSILIFLLSYRRLANCGCMEKHPASAEPLSLT